MLRRDTVKILLAFLFLLIAFAPLSLASEGMEEALIQQEFFGSFDAQIPGAYFADQLQQAKDQNRVGRIPIEPSLQVHTAWDLGISDSMSIWFFQAMGKEETSSTCGLARV